MCATYSARNPLFRFTPNVPRRVLTVPSEGAGNDGLDNAEFNFIARVNDVLDAPGTSYSVLDLLGQGTFGQVFRCQDHATKDIVAIKVVKNKPAYRNQALLEIQVAKLVREIDTIKLNEACAIQEPRGKNYILLKKGFPCVLFRPV